MWITAIVLGFAGSLHCAGMCSPLAMSVTNIRGAILFTRLIYNAGRIFTYGLMGAFASSFGSVIAISGFQDPLSIFLGILLLVAGFLNVIHFKIPLVSRGLQTLTLFLKTEFGVFLKMKSKASIFLLGTLNGILPCGLSFVALTYCFTLRGAFDGFFFMLLFGVGTLPVMLGLTTVIMFLLKRSQFNFSRVITILLIVSGGLLIVRPFVMHGSSFAHHENEIFDIVLCF